MLSSTLTGYEPWVSSTYLGVRKLKEELPAEGSYFEE